MNETAHVQRRHTRIHTYSAGFLPVEVRSLGGGGGGVNSSCSLLSQQSEWIHETHTHTHTRVCSCLNIYATGWAISGQSVVLIHLHLHLSRNYLHVSHLGGPTWGLLIAPVTHLRTVNSLDLIWTQFNVIFILFATFKIIFTETQQSTANTPF